jgi:hypothetical protein
MACGSCGGAAARTMQKRAVGEQSKARQTQITKPVQIPKMRPMSTTKIVVSTPSSAIKVKQQLKDLKSCPICGSILSHVVSGSGVRYRKRCLHCNRTFI